MGPIDSPYPEADPAPSPTSASPTAPEETVVPEQAVTAEVPQTDSETSTAADPPQWTSSASAPEPASTTSAASTEDEPTPKADPLIVSTIEIPAQEDTDDNGGEWELLIDKIRSWLNSDDPNALWSKLQLPIKVVGGLILLVLLLRIYGGILSTIDSLPLAPGLLELAGLIWILNFALRNLVRSGDRKQFIDGLRATWTRFTGS